MKSAFYASLAVVPWVAVTLLLRWMVNIEGWPACLVGALSRAVSLPVLAAWIVLFGAGWRSFRTRGQGRALLIMGAVAIIINLSWFNAVRWTTATNVNMLIRFDVVFVVLIGSALGLERIGRKQLALIPVMFVGLCLLMEVQKFDWGGHIVGDALTIVAAFAFSVNAFIIRRILLVMEEEPVALYNHSFSTLGFIGLGIAMGDFSRTGEMLASRTAVTGLVVLGLLVALSLPLYYVALRRMDVWKLRMFMLASPVLAIMVEGPLWGLKMSGLQWLGGGIILGALAVLIWMEWHDMVSKQTTEEQEKREEEQRRVRLDAP